MSTRQYVVRTERHDSGWPAHPSRRAPSAAEIRAHRAALPAEVRGRHGDDGRVVADDVPGAEGEDDGVVTLLPEVEGLGVGVYPLHEAGRTPLEPSVTVGA